MGDEEALGSLPYLQILAPAAGAVWTKLPAPLCTAPHPVPSQPSSVFTASRSMLRPGQDSLCRNLVSPSATLWSSPCSPVHLHFQLMGL